MKKIGPKRVRKFCRLLNKMGRWEPEPTVLVPPEWPDIQRFKREMIRRCKKETP